MWMWLNAMVVRNGATSHALAWQEPSIIALETEETSFNGFVLNVEKMTEKA